MTYGDSAKHYRENPEKYELRKKQVRERERGLKAKIKEYKENLVCSKCGFSDSRAIDFHHRDSAEKETSISVAARKGWSWERIKKELDKCDPLCRNCHAILHAEERENAPLA